MAQKIVYIWIRHTYICAQSVLQQTQGFHLQQWGLSSNGNLSVSIADKTRNCCTFTKRQSFHMPFLLQMMLICPHKLTWVLQNLISNAWSWTFGNFKISLKSIKSNRIFDILNYKNWRSWRNENNLTSLNYSLGKQNFRLSLHSCILLIGVRCVDFPHFFIKKAQGEKSQIIMEKGLICIFFFWRLSIPKSHGGSISPLKLIVEPFPTYIYML